MYVCVCVREARGVRVTTNFYPCVKLALHQYCELTFSVCVYVTCVYMRREGFECVYLTCVHVRREVFECVYVRREGFECVCT